MDNTLVQKQASKQIMQEGFFFPSNVISCISTLIPYILRGNVVNKDQIAKTVIFTVDMLCMQLYIVYNKR